MTQLNILSALRENEIALDSIDGKIKQFTNSLQTMWNNWLGSEIVKDVVDIGTAFIKLADQLGLVGTALAGIFIYITAFKKQNPVVLIGQLVQYLSGFKGWSGFGQLLGQLTGILPVMKAVTDATITNTISTQLNDAAKEKSVLSTLGLTGATQNLSMVERQAIANKVGLAVSQGQLTVAQGNSILAMLGFTGATVAADGAVEGLDATTKSFMATNPVGWFLLVASAVISVVMVIKQLTSNIKTTEEALSDLKSEISNIKSEIDSVNSELETTQSRMAELLAIDSLSFTEEEELKRLQKTNDELQRKLDLLDLENKQKQSEAADKFVTHMEETAGNDSAYDTTGKRTWWDKVAAGLDTEHSTQDTDRMNGEEYFNYLAEQYEAELKKQKDQEGRELNWWTEVEADPNKYASKMSEFISDLVESAKDIEYIKDPQTDKEKEVNDWLDYVNNMQNKWAIVSGGTNATQNAINNVLNREQYSEVSEEIDELFEKLKQDPGNTAYEQKIRDIIGDNEELRADLEASGVSVEDAVKSFTQLGVTSNFSTVDGKIEELNRASKTFEELINGQKFNIDGTEIGLAELFDEEGKVIQTTLSQIFKNTDEQTRKDITSILEGSYDQIEAGTTDINSLLTQFGLKASRQIIDVSKIALSQKNQELFPNLKDEISGIIDTFDELAKAVGNVADAMDLLDQARKEEAYSGSISLETLSQLMEYTDDYSKLVSIDETGAIHLAADAQNILIQEKLDAIKANAELAYNEALVAYQSAVAAQNATGMAKQIQDVVTPVIDSAVGAAAALGSVLGDLVNGNFSGMLSRAASAYNSKKSQRVTIRENSVSDAKAALDRAENNRKIANGLTADNVRDRTQSDRASGDKYKDSEKEEEDKRLENIQKKYEGKISNLENQQTYLENEIERQEELGLGVSRTGYEKQIALEEEKIGLLVKERGELQELQKAYSPDSEEWYEVADAIWEMEHGIQEATTNMIKMRKAIVNLYAEAFTKTQEAYDAERQLEEDSLSYLQNAAELIEMDGGVVSVNMYRDMQAEVTDRKNSNLSRKTVLEAGIQKLRDEKAGYAEWSPEWIEANDQIIAQEAEIRKIDLDIQADDKDFKEIQQQMEDALFAAWDAVIEAYGNIDTWFGNQQDFAQAYIDRLDALNIEVPESAYEEMIDIQWKRNFNLDKELATGYQQLKDIPQYLNDGTENQEYINKMIELAQLEKERYEGDTQITEWQQTILENRFNRFAEFLDRIDSSVSQLQNIASLYDGEDVATEDGNWTAEGLTQAGLAYHEMELRRGALEEINAQMEEQKRLFDRGEISEKTYYERMQELTDQQWDEVSAIEAARDSIIDLNEARIDMIEEGINKQIEAYSELIDLKKEELDAERDLYNFRKDVQKQTKDIAALERRIASMSGSSSASDIAERTKLEKD